ncbi:MAG: LPS assembly protein LptD [Asticcacaulis sp.]
MTKRYKLKLGAGLVSLIAAGAGCGHAMAQARSATVVNNITGTQLSFEMAMAQIAAAEAVATVSPPVERTPTTPGKDGLTQDSSYVEADQIKTTEDGNTVADGKVEMRTNDRTIRADQITTNADTGVTVASGNTQTINEDGSVQFADSITYDDNNETGVSENFAAISNNNSKVFARRFEQVSPEINQLTNVIYTPCALCVKKGETQPPTWSIEAGKITQRKDKKMVFYNNAVIKIHDVPVLYTPFLWTPDPELDRASGFLTPKIGTGRKRGFSYEQPYLWSISPYQYLIISPQFNASVNPLLNLEYQHHFYSGIFHARFGITDDAFFDNRGDRHGASATRGYVLADGAFKINPDWRWSFTAQHVEDDFEPGTYLGNAFPNGGTYANFFERYNIDGTFQKVGDLSVDSRQLINQFNVTRQVSNAYFALTMASFQSLQFGGFLDQDGSLPVDEQTRLQPYTTSSDFFPVIAPQIEAYWSPRSRLLGGQLTLSANAIAIYHKTLSTNINGLRAIDIGAPELSDGVTGYDTMRASAGASWYGDMTTHYGLKWGPFFDVRHDEYNVTHLDADGTSGKVSRDLGTAGLNLSYPLYRKFDKFIAIIEPVAQLAVSPDAQTNPYLPTEDSQNIEFDETTLFNVNKSTGFDIYEAGSRLSLGLRSELRFNSGMNVQGLIGRILRSDPEAQFLRTVAVNGESYTYDPSGIGNKSSDWIVDGSFDTKKGFNGYTRLRLDGDSGRLSQGEYGLSVMNSRTMATFRYIINNRLTRSQVTYYYSGYNGSTFDNDLRSIRLAEIASNGKLKTFGDNYRNIQLYAQHFFNANWGVSARLDRDMVNNTWRRSTVSLIYRDDCSRFELVYQRNDTQITAINNKPSSSIFFRLNLTTLGSSPSTFNDVR